MSRTTTLMLLLSLVDCRRPPERSAPRLEPLRVSAPVTARVFDTVELDVRLPASVRGLTDDVVHDAFDADRDGRYLRLEASFDSGTGSVKVPGFAMRQRPGGPFVLRVRWSPRKPGQYRVTVSLRARLAHKPVHLTWRSPQPIVARVDAAIPGPLIVKPGARYLHRLRSDGSSEAIWLFGAARAWALSPAGSLRKTGWARHSGIDRENELLAPMRRAGYNLLNQWMAPWEYLLVHHDRAEHWRRSNGTWRRHPLPRGVAWRPFGSFDQGRALAFDRLVSACEGGRGKALIHLLLSPLPHQSLQMRAHPWGADESGWSPADDGGRQHVSKLNGFSGFQIQSSSWHRRRRPSRRTSAWDFFKATPAAKLSDWRSQLFDHQANYFRYLIARWSHSRALGVWVIVDELDAVGDALGDRAKRKGWWAHPQCARWLADVLRLFRGRLVRSDGLRYSGDPYQHPLHAAVTSSDDRIDRGGNLDWSGGPADARPDLMGWHFYPERPEASNDAGWSLSIDGIISYARSPVMGPRLISEFGAPDRDEPSDVPSLDYPTLYHHAIWASLFSGMAGTVIDWDDGKAFGELRWRARAGAFDRQHYPLDNTAQLVALRRFLNGLKPGNLSPCAGVVAAKGVRALALCERAGKAVHGWLFAERRVKRPTFVLRKLNPGRYTLRWFDPWTGEPVPGVAAQALSVKDELTLDPKSVLQRLRKQAAGLSHRLRLARGQDVAFRLTR